VKNTIKDFIEKTAGRKTFLEHEIKGFLRGIGLSIPNGIFVGHGEKIPEIKLKYPLIAKVSSSKITSKSDVGGIESGIIEKDELIDIVGKLMQIKDAEGVIIEEMAPQGLEVIVGGIIDKQFGPVVMFGLGGILVELYKDTAFALAPMKKDDAIWLIQQVKGYKLIQGYRGHPPVDEESLIEVILTVSEIIASGYVEEIDLNPVSLYPEGAIILDAKMVLKEK
jgi:acetyl-CoA synthetase (ADP-forming)